MSENLEKIRPALVALEVGESVSFPISRLKSVRTQASELVLSTTVSSRPGLTGKPYHYGQTNSIETKSGLYEDITVSGPSYTIRNIPE